MDRTEEERKEKKVVNNRDFEYSWWLGGLWRDEWVRILRSARQTEMDQTGGWKMNFALQEKDNRVAGPTSSSEVRRPMRLRKVGFVYSAQCPGNQTYRPAECATRGRRRTLGPPGTSRCHVIGHDPWQTVR